MYRTQHLERTVLGCKPHLTPRLLAQFEKREWWCRVWFTGRAHVAVGEVVAVVACRGVGGADHGARLLACALAFLARVRGGDVPVLARRTVVLGLLPNTFACNHYFKPSIRFFGLSAP